MKNQKNPFGFTLLEMLTAMAIIAIMLGLLIPAISKIQDTAHTVKQKAQFGAIEIALEAFNTDTGDYPPSSYTILGNNNPGGGNNTGYCGAQKLAEAIIGQDGFFHPQSQWWSDGMIDADNNGTGDVPLYMNAANYDTYYPNASTRMQISKHEKDLILNWKRLMPSR